MGQCPECCLGLYKTGMWGLGVEDARGYDRSSIGSPRHSLGPNEGLKVIRLSRVARYAEGLLKLLAVVGICEKKPCSFRPLLLQSLQDENAATSIGKGQK